MNYVSSINQQVVASDTIVSSVWVFSTLLNNSKVTGITEYPSAGASVRKPLIIFHKAQGKM